ncbi:MAG: rubrerythrin family protein [Candidatus Omnitrophica bacterium]|nr:rubrerythrin family protein [Candidatus Omnitrophota bacterium]
MHHLHKMTEEFLKNAFAGESQAHMKYQIFADAAEREGKPNIARMFRAIAYAEQVHATNHLRVLAGIKKTVENLEVAIGGEDFEVQEMYPVYKNAAQFQQEKEAEKSTHYALEAEKIHREMYQQAKQAAADGKDIKLNAMYICPVCGFTVEGEAPEFCPVCGAKRAVFKSF